MRLLSITSAYERKKCCLFKRIFRIQRNGICLFGISFSVLEILTFVYDAKSKTDDVVICATKIVRY